ncbi:bifunctional [glutamine synthetase] adenylyltransferase/[glutamine synthetase]-adenylyl-L-tyrosine phosphorylase [Algicella marina]|uniref:Bifunctional [glutamine synthetase] adenylyltransferase/[glutamine synthetase]-adenylyl-L-tyrosine phosphorylase n=1 Tax=Algicella marina TaxID=2683284 RepID=A0A6P1SZ49_9RHOB|nr:bifunctional [glutamine synthetase] adenylyltransferase/[glutamine synthetase]-adenylyl-L-tyrosine phosphorylase [Algicella marina]QHQ34496.1 bifunctional [glutamine synthetase] adenylyltransferase/[glutamine synthetase]-adenylyl-L-tyrosine phosphorylase [Algicella marina]
MSLSHPAIAPPLPFASAPAEEARARYRDTTIADLAAGAAGCSPYLAGLLAREEEWLREVLPLSREEGLARCFEAEEGAELASMLRRTKARAALWAGLGDLSNDWTLEQVTGALTEVADRAVDTAMRSLVDAEIARGKLPDVGAPCGGLFALAMGKMGAHELNYSSDIDLILLFDETLYPAEDYQNVRRIFVRIAQKLVRILSDNTSEGYVFRTDLRLRPNPSVTPVVIGVGAAERYYEAEGRGWERSAMIKARPCAGDIAAGERFMEDLRPFVWRRHLDFAAIEDAHTMRLRIREHKGLAGPFRLPGHNVKLGQGGIREIEFFAQTHQLILGGRQPELRLRGTCPALKALAEGGWVPSDLAADLATAYRAHRVLEHRLQMLDDAQTHTYPESDDSRSRLALFCGAQDAAAFEAHEAARFKAVHAATEDFFAPDKAVQADWTGFADEEAALERVDGWQSLPALRSDRARNIFRRLLPKISARLATARAPDEALVHFDRFIRGLPAGVQVFSLFDSRPELLDLVVEICAVAPRLAGYLGHNAHVLDSFLSADFFRPLPGCDALEAELRAVLDEVGDYERALDSVRVWVRERHFRVGVQLLRGLAPPEEAAREYADLAEAAVRALLPLVVDEFAVRFGRPPGAGLAVVGMGKLGSREMTASSDLDLIIIYDAAGVEASDGPKSLDAAVYYSRLTKAFLSALTVPTAEGGLYEVDMRLRPSGRQGPVATGLASFTKYQQEEAWTWEHLALTRARVVAVAGEPALRARIETAVREGLCAARPRDEVMADMRDMRRRLLEAKGSGSIWDVKTGPGRLLDMDLYLQAGALTEQLVESHAPRDMLSALADRGYLTPADARTLSTAYRAFSTVQHLARVAVEGTLDRDKMGTGAAEVLCRALGVADIEALEAELTIQAEAAAAVIDAGIG